MLMEVNVIVNGTMEKSVNIVCKRNQMVKCSTKENGSGIFILDLEIWSITKQKNSRAPLIVGILVPNKIIEKILRRIR